jgi:hypothetical protein
MNENEIREGEKERKTEKGKLDSVKEQWNKLETGDRLAIVKFTAVVFFYTIIIVYHILGKGK